MLLLQNIKSPSKFSQSIVMKCHFEINSVFGSHFFYELENYIKKTEKESRHANFRQRGGLARVQVGHGRSSALSSAVASRGTRHHRTSIRFSRSRLERTGARILPKIHAIRHRVDYATFSDIQYGRNSYTAKTPSNRSLCYHLIFIDLKNMI